MICFICPLGVSITVPSGILGSFSKIRSRMLLRMENVDLWDRDRASE